MDKPLYTLRFDEAVWMPKNENGKSDTLKVIVWVIVAIIVIASFIFQESFFKQLSWPVRFMLMALCVGSFFMGGKKKVPSAIEIQFYTDFLIVFRNKHYYSKRVWRKEYNKFKYADIKEIQLRTETKRINLFGVVEGTWYDYRKDGTLPTNPTYHKVTDSICYFYTDFAPDIDFINEFESNCPIKVTISQN